MMARCFNCDVPLNSVVELFRHKADEHPDEEMTVVTKEYPPLETTSVIYEDGAVSINWKEPNPTDIGVYTKPDVLGEKIRYAHKDGYFAWWNLPYSDKLFSTSLGRIYFAVQNKWRGYFTVKGTAKFEKELRVFLGRWHTLSSASKRTPFRGFTYDVPEVEK